MNDNHWLINFAQEILKWQFNELSGLQSTLLLSRLKEPLPATGGRDCGVFAITICTSAIIVVTLAIHVSIRMP